MMIRVVCAVMLVHAIASADEYAEMAQQLDHSLAHPAPLPGLDRAPVRPVPWCTSPNAKQQDDAWAGTIINSMQDYRSSHFSQGRLIESARLLCNAPSNPVAQRAAAEIEQYWINESGLSETDAVASLAARVDKDAFDAERDKLCASFPDVDSDDDDRVYSKSKLTRARQRVLGCGTDPLWLSPGVDMSDIAPFLDRGEVERDDVAHMAWILNRTAKALDPSERPERVLVGYVIDQFDLHAVTAASVARLIDTAPFKGNRYARVVLLESFGAVKLAATRYEAAVAAKTTDHAWKELLVTAPQRGYNNWLAAAAKQKDVLAHSDEFAAKGKKHGAGCQNQLRPEFLAIAKKLKHDDLNTFRISLSDDPIAGLLMHRLVLCMIADGDQAGGQALDRLGSEVRVIGGPRMAAYYAALDALGDLGDQIHVKPGNLPSLAEPLSSHPDGIDSVRIKGVIASVSKTGKGVRVTFVKTRVHEMTQSCTETNKVDRVENDGKLVYRQSCHDTGMKWIDTTPDPVVVKAALAGGLAAGRFAKFDDNMSSDVIPIDVFADAVGKRLIAFGGLFLE